MSRRIDSMISDYIVEYVKLVHGTSFSGINVVNKLLKDPGFSTEGSQHRVLWWPKNHRIAQISKAFHVLSPKEVAIMAIYYKGVINDDGSTFTKEDLAKNSTIGLRRFGEIHRNAKRKVKDALKIISKESKA